MPNNPPELKALERIRSISMRTDMSPEARVACIKDISHSALEATTQPPADVRGAMLDRMRDGSDDYSLAFNNGIRAAVAMFDAVASDAWNAQATAALDASGLVAENADPAGEVEMMPVTFFGGKGYVRAAWAEAVVAERDKLQEALTNLELSASRVANKYGRDPETDELLDWTEWANVREDCAAARAALKQDEPK